MAEKIKHTTIYGTELTLDKRSLGTGYSWLPSGVYDASTLEFFYRQTRRYKKPVMLDIGAGTGLFSMLAFLNKDLSCHAFEPLRSSYEILCNNITFNGLENRVTAYNIALWHKKGQEKLKVPASNLDAGLACLGGNIKRFKDYAEVSVDTITLDGFAKEHAIEKADIVKIDTEGCEKFVLLGGEKYIKSCYPDILLEFNECNMGQFNYKGKELLELLASWGYSFKYCGEDIFCRRQGRVLGAVWSIEHVVRTKVIQRAKNLFDKIKKGLSFYKKLAPGRYRAWDHSCRISKFSVFLGEDASQINRARLEHLESMGLDIAGKSVLEVGAGIGLLTHFFENQNCRTLSVDARTINVNELKRRFPHRDAKVVDLEKPGGLKGLGTFDEVFCYGTLYHLSYPGRAIKVLSEICREMILIETCVTPGSGFSCRRVREHKEWANQSLSGRGSRPSRPFVMEMLKKYFGNAYVAKYQPDHEDFKLDWRVSPQAGLCRAVFVGSRRPIDNKNLSTVLLDKQDSIRKVAC